MPPKRQPPPRRRKGGSGATLELSKEARRGRINRFVATTTKRAQELRAEVGAQVFLCLKSPDESHPRVLMAGEKVGAAAMTHTAQPRDTCIAWTQMEAWDSLFNTAGSLATWFRKADAMTPEELEKVIDADSWKEPGAHVRATNLDTREIRGTALDVV